MEYQAQASARTAQQSARYPSSAVTRTTPLFFTVAAVTSEHQQGCVDNLSLLPHGAGWESGRGSDGPHEMILRLDTDAVIKEIVISSVAGKVPKTVEVAISRDGMKPAANWPGLSFEPFGEGVVDFSTDHPTNASKRGPRRALQGLSTGSFVRLRFSAPLVPNTYRQVGCRAVEIWGRASHKSRPQAITALNLAKQPQQQSKPTAGELTRVLMELGMPLECLPDGEGEVGERRVRLRRTEPSNCIPDDDDDD